MAKAGMLEDTHTQIQIQRDDTEDTDTFAVAVADTDAQSDTLDSLGCLLCLALRIWRRAALWLTKREKEIE